MACPHETYEPVHSLQGEVVANLCSNPLCREQLPVQFTVEEVLELGSYDPVDYVVIPEG